MTAARRERRRIPFEPDPFVFGVSIGGGVLVWLV